MDAIFLLYPTESCKGDPCTSEKCLHVRLSEMYLHDRWSYIIHESLQKYVMLLLDQIEASAQEKGSVNVVMNEGGLLKGYWCEGNEEILQKWIYQPE